MSVPVRRPCRSVAAACAVAAIFAWPALAQTLPPRYDHVVVVVIENVNSDEIVGSPAAPYLNSLVQEGAYFSNLYAFTHQSSPNYGELFSGFHNGMTNAGPPPGAPLNTPNLGAELRQAGLSFAGYSQSLPEIGSTVWDAEPYARRHNPWVNWQNDAPGALPNQLPSTTNLRYDDFPTPGNYASLPTVSFVVPDNAHNMHDGDRPAAVTTGDTWLHDNIDPYYQWAKTHNSLLIITPDEDNPYLVQSDPNYMRIPVIMAGANVKPGVQVPQTYTMHNLLRTVEDVYGLSHAGMANNVRPVVGPFAGDPDVNTTTFRNGLNGYTGATDTQIRQAAPNTPYATSTVLATNGDDDPGTPGVTAVHSLIRFDNLFGSATGQIPFDATILSAKLTAWTTDTGTTTTPVEFHRMLKGWNDTDTWATFGGRGVAADDVEAAAAVDFTYAPPNVSHPFAFDVSDTVQRWLDGAPNDGWAILPTGADDYNIVSSEGLDVQRPSLEVSYALYPRFVAQGGAGSWGAAASWAHGTPDAPAAVARLLNIGAATTITLDGNRTLGTLQLDSAYPYTIKPGSAADATLTFANRGNVATIQAKRGQHTLAVPVVFADPGAFDVAAGAQLTATRGVTLAAGKTLTKVGDGAAQIVGGLTVGAAGVVDVRAGQLGVDRINGQGSVAIHQGATLRLTGNAQASLVSGLSFDGASRAWGGRLDLGHAGLVIEYGATSPFAQVADQLLFARAGGWVGAGIGSSAAAIDPGGVLGLAEASSVLALSGGQDTAPFMGQTVHANSLLVRYTKPGDATLDGTVDFNDLVKLAQNYNAPVGSGAWSRGDFNYDGVVDFNDLVQLAQNYNTALAPPAPGASPADFATDLSAAFAQVAMPEPTSVAFLLALTAPTLVARRRRRT